MHGRIIQEDHKPCEKLLFRKLKSPAYNEKINLLIKEKKRKEKKRKERKEKKRKEKETHLRGLHVSYRNKQAEFLPPK